MGLSPVASLFPLRGVGGMTSVGSLATSWGLTTIGLLVVGSIEPAASPVTLSEYLSDKFSTRIHVFKTCENSIGLFDVLI